MGYNTCQTRCIFSHRVARIRNTFANYETISPIVSPDYHTGKAIEDDGVLRGQGFDRLPGPYHTHRVGATRWGITLAKTRCIFSHRVARKRNTFANYETISPIVSPDYRAGKAIGDDGVLRGEGFDRLPGPYNARRSDLAARLPCGQGNRR
jgi:hypothetical protein